MVQEPLPENVLKGFIFLSNNNVLPEFITITHMQIGAPYCGKFYSFHIQGAGLHLNHYPSYLMKGISCHYPLRSDSLAKLGRHLEINNS